jgi:hypothetical protein
MMRATLIGALLCLVAAPVAGAAQRCTAHGVVAVGHDSNPLERIEARHRQGDLFTRLEAGVRCALGAPPGAGEGALTLRWGTDRYLRERGETRHIVQAGAAWRWGDQWRELRLGYAGLLRAHPQADERRVRRHELTARGHWRTRNGWSMALELRAATLRRGIGPGSSLWDPGARDGWRIGGEVERRMRSTWSAIGRCEASGVDYDRPAADLDPGGAAIALEGGQRDRSLYLGAGLAHQGVPMLRLIGGWQRTTSNSYGVAFRRWRFDLLAGGRLPWRVQLLLAGRWEPGERREEAGRLVDPTADPDDPEFGARNELTLRCVRPVAAGWAIELQAAWQQNEARLPWDRYEKRVLSAALRFESRR